MYISLKWIQNLIGLRYISLTLLSEKLTLSGFEIEEILKTFYLKETDFVLNINLTANRSDLFNITGFAREISSILIKKKEFYQVPPIQINNLYSSITKKKNNGLKCFMWNYFLQRKYFYFNKKNNISPFNACYTFFYLESNPLKISPSPQWLQRCLNTANINIINNVYDTINFVTLETSYPFFACDLSKLKIFLNTTTFTFSTRYALPQQKFELEINKFVELSEDNLILYINNMPVSIIGLLTLKDIEINDTTKEILIYGGLFDSVQMRKSSQILGLRTQQSINLEKNLNFNNLEQAFIRLKSLLKVQNITFSKTSLPKIAIIQTLKKESFNRYIKNTRPVLKLKYKEVNNLRGNSKVLTNSQIISILENLNFKILRTTEKTCQLHIPLSREEDIEREVDLLEEIIRINGFNNFLSIEVNLKQLGTISKLEKLKRILKNHLINLGLNEVLHYTINSNVSFNKIKLKNPIVTETSFFRTSLLNELINKYNFNKNQKNKNFEAFEIGRIYSITPLGDVRESEVVSGIFGGTIYNSYWSEQKTLLNWFEAKGFMEQLFSLLKISPIWRKLDDKQINLFHPNRSAQLVLNKQNIGVFGQIHPFIAKTNSIMDEVYLFEFNLNLLNSLWKPVQILPYVPYSFHPVSIIDLAFIKSNRVTFEEIENNMYEIGTPLLESIELFDYYEGSIIPLGYHSLAFKLKFRSFKRTLTTQEINVIIKKMKTSLEMNFDIIIRE
jgi:phenylalanyl-tRNA synthetase beta chain